MDAFKHLCEPLALDISPAHDTIHIIKNVNSYGLRPTTMKIAESEHIESDLDILTRRYTIGDVHVHKFSGKVNSCCEPVYNFHRMKTHIHVHQHLEVTTPSNMPSTISIENTVHLLS
jgi:hypothetical protein